MNGTVGRSPWLTAVNAEKLESAIGTLSTNEPIVQFFRFSHLPEDLREVSIGFAMLALDAMVSLPRNAERTTALRKLLEAKDCAVRAKLMK